MFISVVSGTSCIFFKYYFNLNIFGHFEITFFVSKRKVLEESISEVNDELKLYETMFKLVCIRYWFLVKFSYVFLKPL